MTRQQNTAIALRPQAHPLGPVAPPPLTATNVAELETLGRMCAASGFFQDSREAAQAMVKIAAGQELGLAPIQAMTGINVIKGRITLSANLMAALIKRAGYRIRVKWEGSQAVALTIFDPQGEELGESSFSLQDAKQAGLSGGNWSKYPRNMLYARAVSNAARWYAPEVLTGCYLPDELEDISIAPRQVDPGQTIRHHDAPVSRQHADTVEVDSSEYPPPIQAQAEEMRAEQREETLRVEAMEQYGQRTNDRDAARRRLHAVGAESGFEHAHYKFLLGLDSSKKATIEEMEALADMIGEWGEDQCAIAKELLACTNLPDLKDTFARVHNGQRRQLTPCKNMLKGMVE